MSTKRGALKKLVDNTVYECPSCDERLLGAYGCEGLQPLVRKLGLGIDHESEIVLITGLLALAPGVGR